MPRISILMPVCNADFFLEETINSIKLQHFVDWELIAVDDFSADSSLAILTQLSIEDKRIHVFSNETKGIVPALSLAFSKSTGAYVTRMDADDIMPEFKLNELLHIAEQNPKNIATGLVNYFSDKPISHGYVRYQNWLNQISAENLFYQNIYRECIIASPNWMVHRSCFESDIVLSELNYPEDYDLVFQWYLKGYSIVASTKTTHLWREHADRTSRNSEIYQQESFFRLKTNYFIQIELSHGEKVQLIGAGKKGKLVAEILQESKIEFDWFEYGIVENNTQYKSVEDISSCLKTILTNWPTNIDLQRDVEDFINSKELVFGKNIWLF